MRDDLTRGAPPPPANEQRYFPVERPRYDKPIRAVVLSDVIWGFWTHYVTSAYGGSARTKPCYGEATCGHKHDGAGFHWYGFVCAVTGADKLIGLLMHAKAGHALKQAARADGLSLRGLDVSLKKRGPQNWAEIDLTLHARRDPSKLPEAFDLEPSLCRLWDVDSLPVFAPLLSIVEGAS